MKRINENVIENCPFRKVKLYEKMSGETNEIPRNFCHKLFMGRLCININLKG